MWNVRRAAGLPCRAASRPANQRSRVPSASGSGCRRGRNVHRRRLEKEGCGTVPGVLMPVVPHHRPRGGPVPSPLGAALNWDLHGPTSSETLLLRRVVLNPARDSGRLHMDHDNMAGTHGPTGPGRPDPGKAVLAFNGVVAAVGGTSPALIRSQSRCWPGAPGWPAPCWLPGRSDDDRRPRRSVHGRVLAAPDGLEPRRPPPGENRAAGEGGPGERGVRGAGKRRPGRGRALHDA